MNRTHKGRILVVDDLPDMRGTLSGLLRDEGYEVSVAASTEEAQQLLTDAQYDLVVLDVRLDEVDENNREGLALMHEIGPGIRLRLSSSRSDMPTWT